MTSNGVQQWSNNHLNAIPLRVTGAVFFGYFVVATCKLQQAEGSFSCPPFSLPYKDIQFRHPRFA